MIQHIHISKNNHSQMAHIGNFLLNLFLVFPFLRGNLLSNQPSYDLYPPTTPTQKKKSLKSLWDFEDDLDINKKYASN